MANELVKLKTGTIAKLEHVTNGAPDVKLDAGTVYFAVDTSDPNHGIGKIVYDVSDGNGGISRIVMSTQAEYAQDADTAVNVSGVVGINHGGTGATNAADARTNLGITPANLGAAAASHTHPIKTITGTIPTSTSSPWTINTTNKTVQISDSKITAKSVLQWGLASTATQAQYEAFAEAQFIDSTTAAGSATIKALGTMPTVAIPVVIHILGETE